MFYTTRWANKIKILDKLHSEVPIAAMYRTIIIIIELSMTTPLRGRRRGMVVNAARFGLVWLDPTCWSAELRWRDRTTHKDGEALNN